MRASGNRRFAGRTLILAPHTAGPANDSATPVARDQPASASAARSAGGGSQARGEGRASPPPSSGVAVPTHSGRSGGNSARCSAGIARTPASVSECRPPRAIAGRSARRPRPPTSRRSPSVRSTCSTTSLRRRSPTEPCTGPAPGLGVRPDGPLPRPDGRPGEAERPIRDRLHVCDQPVPIPDRVPDRDPKARAGVADAAHQRPDAGTRRTPSGTQEVRVVHV
jgi:hypothetical protein